VDWQGKIGPCGLSADAGASAGAKGVAEGLMGGVKTALFGAQGGVASADADANAKAHAKASVECGGIKLQWEQNAETQWGKQLKAGGGLVGIGAAALGHPELSGVLSGMGRAAFDLKKPECLKNWSKCPSLSMKLPQMSPECMKDRSKCPSFKGMKLPPLTPECMKDWSKCPSFHGLRGMDVAMPGGVSIGGLPQMGGIEGNEGGEGGEGGGEGNEDGGDPAALALAPDLNMGEFSASLEDFANHGFAKKPQPAQVLNKIGFLTPRAGFGADSGTDSFVSPTHLEEKKPYPGIDYMGMGYDIFSGNPEGDWQTMSDPGFRLPVRKLSYIGVTMTRDMRYLTPDGSVTYPLTACARSEIARDKATESRLANALNQDVETTEGSSETKGKGEANAYSFATAKSGTANYFAASNGVRQQRSRELQGKYYEIDVKSYCEKTKAVWLDQQARNIDLTPDFLLKARECLALAEDVDWKNTSLMDMAVYEKAKECFTNLFRHYGTHFVREMVLGGKMIYSKYINTTAVSEASTNGVDVVQEAGEAIKSSTEKSGGFFGVGVSESTTTTNTKDESFSKSFSELSQFEQQVSNSATTTVIMGGNPPGKGSMSMGGFAEWANTVTLNPVPVRYKLSPLSELAEAIADSAPPPPPSPPPPPPVPRAPFPPGLPIIKPSAAASSMQHSITAEEDVNAQAIYLEATRQSPPPPPRLPKDFDYKERCVQGTAVSRREVHVADVDIDPSDLWPSLALCWQLVYERFPSKATPLSRNENANGFMLGVRGVDAKGICFAEFDLTSFELSEPQHGDWVTCRPPLNAGDNQALPKAFEWSFPPPPPSSPPPPPPSPPPPPNSVRGEAFINAYIFFRDVYKELLTQSAFLDQSSNMLMLGGGYCVRKALDNRWNDRKDFLAETSFRVNLDSISHYSPEEQEKYCYNQCLQVTDSAGQSTQAAQFSEKHSFKSLQGAPTAGIALEYYPHAEDLGDVCQCLFKCPQVVYRPESLPAYIAPGDAVPPYFKSTLRINCAAPSTQTPGMLEADFLCNPASYDPWPARSVSPPPPSSPPSPPAPPPLPSPPPSPSTPPGKFCCSGFPNMSCGQTDKVMPTESCNDATKTAALYASAWDADAACRAEGCAGLMTSAEIIHHNPAPQTHFWAIDKLLPGFYIPQSQSAQLGHEGGWNNVWSYSGDAWLAEGASAMCKFCPTCNAMSATVTTANGHHTVTRTSTSWDGSCECVENWKKDGREESCKDSCESQGQVLSKDGYQCCDKANGCAQQHGAIGQSCGVQDSDYFVVPGGNDDGSWALADIHVGNAETKQSDSKYMGWVAKAWKLCKAQKGQPLTVYVAVWANAGYRCYTNKNCPLTSEGDVATWSYMSPEEVQTVEIQNSYGNPTLYGDGHCQVSGASATPAFFQDSGESLKTLASFGTAYLGSAAYMTWLEKAAGICKDHAARYQGFAGDVQVFQPGAYCADTNVHKTSVGPTVGNHGQVSIASAWAICKQEDGDQAKYMSLYKDGGLCCFTTCDNPIDNPTIDATYHFVDSNPVPMFISVGEDGSLGCYGASKQPADKTGHCDLGATPLAGVQTWTYTPQLVAKPTADPSFTLFVQGACLGTKKTGGGEGSLKGDINACDYGSATYNGWLSQAWDICPSGTQFFSVWDDGGYECYTSCNQGVNSFANCRTFFKS
jgi:hypothetical protein